MKRRDVGAATAAANPFDSEEVAGLSLTAAEDELLSGILAERVPASPQAPQRSVRARGPRPARFALGAAALAAGLVAFFLISGSEGRPTVQPVSAYAAEVVRYADASPRLLISAPGWRIEGLQAGDREGEMQFVRGNAPMPEENVTVIGGNVYGRLPAATRQRKVELTWVPVSLVSFASRVRDRAYDAQVATTAPVLDTTARVFQYPSSRPGDLDVTSLWQEGDLVVEYRAPVPSMAAFKAQLASLEKVDTETWVAAMPASVVRPAEFEPTVRRMLKGIAVPPGFTAADVVARSIPTDRYQLGASVAGAVSCTWFARWAAAKRTGNQDELRDAIAAMATARDWPVIRQMSSEGAYGQILNDLATAMPRGSVYKQRPLEGDVESALSCGRMLGIPIPGTGFYHQAHISG
jgi:hypothetical protein